MKSNGSLVVFAWLVALILCGAALCGVSTTVQAQTRKHVRLGRACVAGPCDAPNAIFGPPGDYDGSGQTNYAVWRPSEGNWYVLPSNSNNTNTFISQQWGTLGDIPVPGDYDGDGITDFAVFRPSDGNWYVLPSSMPSMFITQQWGQSGDIPVPGDYDNDGITDFAVWRPSEGNWYIIPSSAPNTTIMQQWGTTGDIPMPGDYDGDGQTDFAVWRPSEGNWYVIPSSSPGTFITQQWGEIGDTPVSGDFNGDGITDYAIWRLPSSTWFVLLSGTMGQSEVQQWGTTGDLPVPGDYDGDGITDFAVWRPSNGTWYVLPSSAPGTYLATQWGIATDEPVVDTAPEIGTSNAASATLRVPASASSEIGVEDTTPEGGVALAPQVRAMTEAGAVIGNRGDRPVEEAVKPVRYWLPEAFQRKIGNRAPEKEIRPLSDLSRSIGVPAKVSPEDAGKTNILVVPSDEQKQP